MQPLSVFLKSIPDHRRAQGKRISLDVFLSMYILSNMSGNYSMQSVARFFNNNAETFRAIFNLEHKPPGYTHIRTMLETTDFESVQLAFKNWASQFLTEDTVGKWVSIDGKCLKSTVTNPNNSLQNFHAMVSVFVAENSLILNSIKYENKKDSEIDAVIELVESLKNMGLIITLDALHCKKKQPKQSWIKEMTI